MNAIGITVMILFPGVVGINLLSNYAGNALAHMAGWLTVLPYVTTTIWIALIILSWQFRAPYFALVSIIPCALILIWIYWSHRHILIGHEARFSAQLLFGLACLRWINSFFIGFIIASIYPIDLEVSGLQMSIWATVSIIVGIALPPLYAAVALIVTRSVSQNANLKRKNHEELDEIVEV